MVEGTREIDSKACDEVEFGDAKQTLRKRRRRPLVGAMHFQSINVPRAARHTQADAQWTMRSPPCAAVRPR